LDRTLIYACPGLIKKIHVGYTRVRRTTIFLTLTLSLGASALSTASLPPVPQGPCPSPSAHCSGEDRSLPCLPPLPRRPPFPCLCADGGAYFVPIELLADTTTSALKGLRLPCPHWLGVLRASPCGPSTTCSGLDGRRTSKLAMIGISSPRPLLDSALSNAAAALEGLCS
jgi:hypothetical protein